MKIERTKNAIRNIVYGFVLRIYQMLIPFMMRTAIIHIIGVEYLGLSSLFTSILQVLNLAELGVGSAMVYSMYKPIAEDDDLSICALMKLYRMYYRIIGLVIAVVGLLMTPLIPKLILGEVPDAVNIYVLYLLNLGATVLSYWLFAYKASILQAHQRTDVVNKILILTSTLQYILQLAVLFIFKNYYYYVIVLLVTQALNNVVTALVADKLYPEYKPQGNIDQNSVRQINRKVKDLFTSKVGGIVVNSADTVVIAAFLGLTVLAVYQNYYYILTAVIGVVAILFSSCTAGIGNSIITETKEKNFHDLKKITFIIVWISTFCSCCLLNLYQPFMEIWVGKDLMLDYASVICLVIYYFIYEINQMLNVYKDAAGIWHEDRFRPLVTAIANVGLNLATVRLWGIYGVLLSTVISMLLIGMPWLLHNLFSTIFQKRWLGEYLHRMFYYITVSIIICVLTTVICRWIYVGKWFTLLCRLAFCIVFPNIIMWITYRRFPEFKQTVLLADAITKGNFKLKKLFKVE